MYYEKYKEDVHRVKDIIRYIQKEHVILPSGGNFSVLRLRQLGVYFGFHGHSGRISKFWIQLTSEQAPWTLYMVSAVLAANF